MTAPFRQREMAFEVHLPQLVGSVTLEPLIGTGMLVAALLQQPCRRRISVMVLAAGTST